MKKIVALVLSLVMVLGLATVAMADTTTTTLKYTDGYKLYTMTGTDDLNTLKSDYTKSVTGNVTTTVGDKTTVKYTATTYTVDGNVLTEVDATVAKYKLVKDNAIVAYLTDAGAVSTEAVVTKAVTTVKAEKATCGDYVGDGEAVVFVIDGKAYESTGANWAVYNGKFVNYGNVVTPVAHKYAANTYSAADASIATVKCTVCKNVYNTLTAKQVATMLPAAYTYDATLQVYVATGATVAADADTDKVESAETFDAGIAMYVGMSVMAAAGSAVVLKKKD